MIRASFERLTTRYGAQHWWPAEDPFEVMVGAVLVQRTSWRNASQAVDRLRVAGCLDFAKLAAAKEPWLREIVKPAGFYNSKARRLIVLARFVSQAGGIDALGKLATSELRRRLLGLEGIGEETADAILLYAFERPVCVVDAYLRRWHARMSGETVDDEGLRQRVLSDLPTAREQNELHALIVEHGKRHCRKTPDCIDCCLREECAHAGN